MQVITFSSRSSVRLDAFLQKKYPQLNTGKLNKYLRENKIKVNGKKVPLATKLEFSDEIKLFIPDDILIPPPAHLKFTMAKKILNVIYEDRSVIIVDKPAGLVVMDDSGRENDNLLNRVLTYLYDKNEYDPLKSEYTPYLCHRLDTGTSGLVILAKTKEVENEIANLIKNHSIKKEYLCVTFGRPTVKSKLMVSYHTKNAEKGTVRISDTPINNFSKKIQTQYSTLAVSGRLALLKVNLLTGRTHQIRAHLASIDCPVLGDSKYGNNAANREMKMKYQALCAWKLTFPKELPACLENLEDRQFEADKPWYYNQVLDGTLK